MFALGVFVLSYAVYGMLARAEAGQLAGHGLRL